MPIQNDARLSIVSLLFALGCLSASLSSPAAAQPIAFRFEGQYEPGLIPPPEYAIEPGTPVRGEFSYDLASVDSAVSDDVGFYEQFSPYRLEFWVGDSIFFQTDQYGSFDYRVAVENDASQIPPTRDRFHVFSADSKLASSYGVDVVYASMTLQDLTARAFDDDGLPTDLSGFDLSAPGAGWLFLSAHKFEGDVVAIVFTHRFRIDSIARVAGKTVTVDCDIKPGNPENVINPMSRGVIPVAILGSEEFRTEEIDPATLVFGSGDLPEAHAVRERPRDVNGDGWLDLIADFRTEASGILPGDERACVAGETFAGTPFEGCDSIRTVGRQHTDGQSP